MQDPFIAVSQCNGSHLAGINHHLSEAVLMMLLGTRVKHPYKVGLRPHCLQSKVLMQWIARNSCNIEDG